MKKNSIRILCVYKDHNLYLSWVAFVHLTVYKDHNLYLSWVAFVHRFDCIRLLVYKDHNLYLSWVAFVHRFDCISLLNWFWFSFLYFEVLGVLVKNLNSSILKKQHSFDVIGNIFRLESRFSQQNFEFKWLPKFYIAIELYPKRFETFLLNFFLQLGNIISELYINLTILI